MSTKIYTAIKAEDWEQYVGQKCEGYLWWSNRQKADHYKEVPAWPKGLHPFVVEGAFYLKEQDLSLSIRFLNGAYEVAAIDLGAAVLVEKEEQKEGEERAEEKKEDEKKKKKLKLELGVPYLKVGHEWKEQKGKSNPVFMYEIWKLEESACWVVKDDFQEDPTVTIKEYRPYVWAFAGFKNPKNEQ